MINFINNLQISLTLFLNEAFITKVEEEETDALEVAAQENQETQEN